MNVSSSQPSDASILIVEDDLVAAEIFQQILHEKGYSVRVAGNAESGWLELDQALPAAILLDVRLPNADGLTFLRRVRAAGHHQIPVVVITGDYLIEDQVIHDLEQLGAKVYFKPLWDDQLLDIIRALLASF